MADMPATGKNITSGHFQIIVNVFQPVFHVHWFFVKSVYLSNIKVGGDNLIESIKLLFSKAMDWNSNMADKIRTGECGVGKF